MFSRARACSDAGFTLVEVLVAMFILLVGVLGVVSMVNGANAVTSKTKAREGGTSIARSVIEVSRSIRYRDLTVTSLADALAAAPGPGRREADRRPATTVLTARHLLHDDADRLLARRHARRPRAARPAGVTFCADTDTRAAGNTTRTATRTTTSACAFISTGRRAPPRTASRRPPRSSTRSVVSVPPVTGLTMTSPASSSTDEVRIESSSASPVNSASFLATSSGFAADLNWSINGDSQGKANGGPTNWTFTWNFTKPGVDPNNIVYYDCKYFVQADAFDAEGRAGTPAS